MIERLRLLHTRQSPLRRVVEHVLKQQRITSDDPVLMIPNLEQHLSSVGVALVPSRRCYIVDSSVYIYFTRKLWYEGDGG